MTLHANAVKLAAIKTVCRNPLPDQGRKSLINFAVGIPAKYASTGESGLEAVAETCLAGNWGAEAKGKIALRGCRASSTAATRMLRLLQLLTGRLQMPLIQLSR